MAQLSSQSILFCALLVIYKKNMIEIIVCMFRIIKRLLGTY